MSKERENSSVRGAKNINFESLDTINRIMDTQDAVFVSFLQNLVIFSPIYKNFIHICIYIQRIGPTRVHRAFIRHHRNHFIHCCCWCVLHNIFAIYYLCDVFRVFGIRVWVKKKKKYQKFVPNGFQTDDLSCEKTCLCEISTW